ncbi:MAG: T9SS type A sorting domain-containing protein [Candidatus Stygibacter frigidus]|nr:T9SS type A sorting domain-containing protein [Candidatus Stygibacter frigidus]
MKKIFIVIIVSFLIFGLSLNAKTGEKTVLIDVDGLAPQQLIGTPDTSQEVLPEVNRDPDYQVYAFNGYDPLSIIPVGPITFVLNDPADVTSLAETTAPTIMSGACWVAEEETWYCCQYAGDLYSIDHITGVMTYIAPSIGLNGIEYDNGIMYGTDGWNLYTVDWTTGVTTLIGPHDIDFAMVGIACDGEGNMYGITVDGVELADLYLIDVQTGIATSIGSTGAQLLYAQDIAYDKDAGVLYSVAYFGDGTPSGLYTIDTNTAAMTLIGDFPNNLGVTALAIPYILAEPGAPADPANLAVTPDGAGGLNCEISWTCPDLTYGGDPLTELLEMRVYREGELVYTDNAPVIGGAGNYSDIVTAPEMYVYKVDSYNSEGHSPGVCDEVWVGQDIPDAVTDLVLSDVSTDILIAHLDWINPTTGIHGGYFTGVTGYNIERSDGAVFNMAGSTTSWQDYNIPGFDLYTYTVTPYNAIGYGPSTTSNESGIGFSVVQIGNGEVESDEMPFNLGYLDNMVEIVYPQEWLGTGMIINSVSFHASFETSMNNGCELEIWLGLTDEDDLTNGWIDGTNLQQVFGDTIIVPAGDAWVEIPLDVSFVYENLDNLVMLIISNDDEYYPLDDLWWCTESGTQARTRVDYTNNVFNWEFNAFTGPWDGDEVRSIYPDIRFHYTSLVDPQSPDASTDVTFAADAGGALETQIDWTCPTLNYSGSALTELLEMRVYRDDLLIYTDTNPTIGGTGTYSDAAVPLPGLHEYQVVGYNSFGAGITVYGELWVGEDMPGAVDNLVLTQTTPNILSGTLTWDNPMEGSHGGPFNEPIQGYHIERNDGITIELSGSATSYIDDSIPISDYYCYTVVPYNGVGDGTGMTSNLALIADNDILMMEDFSNTVPPIGWYIDGMGQTNWSSSATSHAGGTAPELFFDWLPQFSGISRMCSNTVDTSGMDALTLEFKYRVYDWLGGYTLGVATSSEGITWNDVWTIIPDGTTPTPPTTVNVDITNADVGSDTFQICIYFNGDSYSLCWWYLDDVMLGEEIPFLPPENVAIDASLGLVTWEEPAVDADGKATTDRELTGYNVWLNDVQQNTALVTDLEYQLTGLENGIMYVAGVSAVYDDPGESDIIEVPFTYSGVGADNDFQLVTELGGNYPNPFNPTTQIKFSLKDNSRVELQIYNIKGQLVKTLVDEDLEADFYQFTWYGTDNANRQVSSGVYFYKMKAGKFISTKKMILMK